MNVDERIAMVRAVHATQTKVAILERTVRAEQALPEAEAEQKSSTETVFDIVNNSVAKILQRGDLSDKGKLEAVVQFLSAKEVNYNAAQKNFAEFETYFTYAQSKRTQVSE